MKAHLPVHATLKDISATWNQDTIPRTLQVPQALPAELWAQVVVMDGEVDLKCGGETRRVTPGAPAVVPPGVPFFFAATGKPVRFDLHYFHEAVLSDGKSLAGLMGRARAA